MFWQDYAPDWLPASARRVRVRTIGPGVSDERIDVQDNDSDPDGDALSIDSLSHLPVIEVHDDRTVGSATGHVRLDVGKQPRPDHHGESIYPG